MISAWTPDSEADSLMESCVYGEDFTNIARGTNQSGGLFFEEASEESPYLFGFNMGAADVSYDYIMLQCFVESC